MCFRRVPPSGLGWTWEGRGQTGTEDPPGARFYPNMYRISGVRVVQKKDSSNKHMTLGACQGLL